MLKKIFFPLLVLLCCICNIVTAQVTPDGILFQAVARDANGNAAAGRNIYAKVNLLKSTATGTSVYAESFKVVSTDDGVFTIVIGKGTRTSGVAGLSSIAWNEALHFVNIQIAIEPSLPTPGWSADNNYVDMGTSQLWTVPYALFSSKATVADSAMSISTIVPGSKGGTGVNNTGRTITLGQNLTFKGTGDITITTTGVSNISLPTTGLLANTQYVSDRIGTDTVSLSNRINALGVSSGNTTALKVNISDTASMLNPYLRKLDTASLSKRINVKLDSAQIPGIIAPYLASVAGLKYADSAAMLLPYAIRSNTIASINTKTNIADTAAMLLPYAIRSNTIASIDAEKTRALAAEVLKVNIADTASMLNRRFARDTVALSNRINLKTNIADTSAMLLPYAIKSNTETSINTKVNIIDTAAMLSPYAINSNTVASIDAEKTRALTAEALKVNIADTASMLNRRFGRDTVALSNRINLKVNISDTALMLSRRFARDTASLSNRINLKTNIADTAAMLLPYAIRSNTIASINAEKARAIAEEALKVNIADTSDMLLPYAIRSNTIASINLKTNIADTALMLSRRFARDTASLSNRINLKTNSADTAAMLLPYAIRSNTVASINAEKARAIAEEALKVNIADTTDMLLPYAIRSNTIASINLKTNIADTALMLSRRFARDTAALSRRINLKTNIEDTAAMLLPYAIRSNTIASINAEKARAIGEEALKVNIEDTAAMLLPYAIRSNTVASINLKTNIADTAAMLLPYAIRSNTIASINLKTNIADTALMLSRRFARDTVSLSNRINALGTSVTNAISDASASNGADLAAEIARATAAEALKVNIADTSLMLTRRFGRDTVSLSNRINLKTNIADTAAMLLPYAIRSNTIASINAEKARAIAEEALKVNIADTTDMLLPYAIRSNTIASINLKTNIADTALMLSRRFARDTASLSNRINLKTNITDTADMLLPYAIRSNTETSINAEKTRALTAEALKVNFSDTSLMLTKRFARDTVSLSNRINALGTSVENAISDAVESNGADLAAEIARATAAENLKVNIADTSLMLTKRFGRDTVALSNRINLKTNIADTADMLLPYAIRSNTETSINAEKSRALTAEALKVNIADTANMLSRRIARDTVSLSNRINALGSSVSTEISNAISSGGSDLAAEIARATAAEALKVNISDTSAMLTRRFARDTVALSNRINLKTNIADTAAMLLPYAVRSNTIASITAETTRAIAAETALDTRVTSNTASITAETTRAIAAETALDTRVTSNTASITAETTRAIAAETALDTRVTSNTASITAETTRAIAAETALDTRVTSNTASITAETTRAIAAETALDTRVTSNTASITAETTRAIAAETALDTRVTTNASNIATNTANINSNTINISNNATNIAANTIAINNRVSFTDMPTFLLPYLKIEDTTNMLANYKAAMIDNNARIDALVADTATLITRFSYKENLSNKSIDVSGDATSDTKYPTVKAVKDFVDNAITIATPDASTTVKGKIQLSGDLAGIAASPSVATVGGSTAVAINAATILANTATDANTVSTIVKRDASGNFIAGTITAGLTGNVTGNVTGNLTGNASTATKLAATKNIYGNAFDGSADLTQAIAGTFGGTGIDNGSKTITLGGNLLTANSFTTAGNFSTTLTSIGETNITLPTTGTIATLAGTETMTNKTIVNVALTGVPTAPTAAAGTSTNQLATTEFVNATTSAATPDASPTVKGKIQLAGDLSGIATSPTVNSVGGSSSSTINTATILANAATDINSNGTIVKRDIVGNFSAGTITADLAGNASTATKLAATKNIYGNAFDGSVNLTQAIAGTFGGTGVNNGNKTITLGGNILTANSFTTVGNYSTTLTSLGETNITLPTTGTIATLAGTETLLNKTLASVNLTGIPTAPTAAANTNTDQVATTAFVLTTTAAATPDATSILKGKVQLTNDFGGTAALPTVVRVGGSTATDINTATILANASTEVNTASAIVKRDANGDFSAGTITANLLGTATNITGIALGANGGTGVNNTGKTITLGGNINTGRNFITTGVSGSGADITFKTTNTTNLILPTAGTLATLAGTEEFTNKTINGLSLIPATIGFSISGGTTSKSLTINNDATVSGTNTGDQTITLTGDVTGSGTGLFATTLASSGVSAGVYGGATSVPTITIDEKGRITNAAATTITGVSSIGSLLESGKIIVGDQNNQAAKVDMSGDISINNAGATTIGANKITTSKLVNSAVTYDKIQNVSATNKILGRVSAGAGLVEEISTIGTGNVVRAISPEFTGTPKVPTATYPSNDGTIASTQYVTTAINNISASSVSGILGGANGGTGVDNTGRTITLGGDVNIAKNFTTTGTTGSNASDITFKTTGPTVLELPLSGKLATMSDVSSSSIGGQQITGIINPVNGGTGVANDNTKLITLGGSITTGANLTTTGVTGSGANITFKTTAATDVILPTTGTIATLAGTEILTAKTISALDNTISNISNASIAASANIDDTKLATISSAGKVLNAATTATNANTADAIVARDANGAFTAGIITASLNGNASSATKLAATKTIYGNAFDGTANLTNIIASGFGGTGNGFTKFIGPAGSEKLFTLPNADATILTSNALVTVGQGGTGAATATQNFVFAGPATGSSAGAPSFRALTAADLPAGSGSYIANSTTQQASSNFNISGAGIVGGNLTANSFIVPGASSTQFLKGDGTLDGATYATAGANANITSLTGLTTALSLAQGGTGSTSKNFADLTTAQTIAGAKTFSAIATFNTDININGLKIGKGNSNTGENTALGVNALSTNTGNYNTATGFEALKLSSSSSYNSGFGSRSLSNNTTGFENTGLGFQSLYTNTTGNTNTALGVNSMALNTTGSFNIGLGNASLYNNTTGENNTGLGRAALFTNTTGSSNTAIGFNADVSTANLNNATALGAGAIVAASNTIQLGNANIANVKTSGTITAGAVTYPKVDGLAGQVLITDGLGVPTFRTLDGAGATLTNGKILVGNASNVATAVNISGDVSITNTGVATIADASITTSKLALGSVETDDLAASAVTFAKMQNIATNKLLGRTTASTGAVEEIAMSGSGNVSRVIVPTYASMLLLNDSHSGALIYTQHNNSPSFPDNLADGFYCTIVNYGGAPCTSNTLTLAKFYTNNTGNTGSSTFTIPLGGTVSVYAITIGGAKRYYINYGDAPAIAGTGLTNNAGTFNVNTSQNISTLSNLTTNGLVTTTGGTGALSVVASLPVTQGGTGLTSLTTGDLLYANGANSLAKLGIGTNGQILTTNGTTISWAPNSSASLSGGVAGAIPYQSAVGVTGYTAAGTSGQFLTSAGTGAPTWTTIIPVANGGTGAATLTSNAVLLGNGTGAVQTVAPGTTGNVLVSNGTTWVSQAAGASGVSLLGSIAATSNVKGATISGSTLTLTPADATNGGIVTAAAQTFAGTKTFADVALSGAINGNSTTSSTIAGFNAAISSVTANLTISSANAATYNGKVLVCSGSAFTVTFDSTVPVGFSCMILQSDNNTVSFAGTNNRYNYTSTSGIYAIATAMCYASGSVLLTGDLQ